MRWAQAAGQGLCVPTRAVRALALVLLRNTRLNLKARHPCKPRGGAGFLPSVGTRARTPACCPGAPIRPGLPAGQGPGRVQRDQDAAPPVLCSQVAVLVCSRKGGSGAATAVGQRGARLQLPFPGWLEGPSLCSHPGPVPAGRALPVVGLQREGGGLSP